jgi:hypothetical protein
MLSLECQFVQYTNEPLDLSFDTVSCIQVRFSPKAFGGRGRMKEVTCGGNALRFYAAVRLRLSRMGLIKTDDKVNSSVYLKYHQDSGLKINYYLWKTFSILLHIENYPVSPFLSRTPMLF